MNPNHPNNVRRYAVSQPSNPQHYADARMQSNPQPIPQTQGINPIPRGTPTGRSFPGFSPAQSPQQHGVYNAPSVYPGAAVPPSDINVPYSSGGPVPSVAKSNGQYTNVWHGQRMGYAPSQPQHSQAPQAYSVGTTPPVPAKYSQQQSMQSAGPYQSFPQNQTPMMPSSNPQYIFMPQGHPVRTQRFVSPNLHSGVTQVQTQLQAASPYFQSQPSPQSYYHQAQITQYSNYDPMYQHSGPPQTMPAPAVIPHQPPAPSSSSNARKSKIKITDPTTGQDVTNDILHSGMPHAEPSASPAGQPASGPAANIPPSQDHIAAQFAARVAAVATASPDRPAVQTNVPPAQAEGRMEAGTKPVAYQAHMQHAAQPGSSAPVIPKGVDTSVPPPSIQRMPLKFAPEASPIVPPPMQAPSPFTKNNEAASVVNGVPAVASAAPIPPPASNAPLNGTRPDAPVAVVQPVRNETRAKQDVPDVDVGEKRSVEIAIKHGMPTDEKMEEIITTAKAIGKLEDSKHEVIINDIVTTKNAVETMEKSSKHVDAVPISNVLDESENLSASTLTESCDAYSESPSNNSNASVNADPKAIGLEEKEVSDPTENQLEETDADTLPQQIQSVPTPVEEISPPSQEDPTSLDATPKDEVVTENKVEVVPDAEETKASVDEFALKAMSGDSAVTENGNKVPVGELQPEPVAAVAEDDKLPLPKVPQVTKISPAKTQGTPVVETPPSQQVVDNPAKEPVFKIPKEIEKEKKEEPSKKEPTTEEIDPKNPSKKKIYDRSFLMQFRYNNISLEKPSDLPVIQDIIMDRPNPKSSSSMPSIEMHNSRSDFTPVWMGGGGGHRPGRNTSRGSRGGYGGGYPHSGSQSAPKVIKKVSIQKEPELNKAENAWKPSKVEAKPSGTATTEEEQTKEVLKNVRAILNKLTPSKFSSLMQKFQLLPINTEIRLRDVINLIFEKAIDEPNFCEAYANMCRTMSQFRVQGSSGTAQNPSGGTVEFRKILLTRCQREFEKDRANENKLLDLRKKEQEAKTPEEAQQYKDERETAEAKERRRMLGNIRFIGELFKLSMLTESIMHNCIMTLFKSREEESLESLCRLLTTIGKDLDHQKGKQRMDQYFTQIEKIIRERKTSSRVRFMLQDVIDLRQSKWVQRAIKAQGPKTIDQIHADAKEEKEQLALQVAAAAAAPPMKSQSRGNRMGSRGGGGHNENDGWTKVGIQQKPIRYDPQKMKLSKQQFDESNVTLGPNRGKSAWKSGSGSSATKTGSGGYSVRDNMDNLTARSSTPTMMNRFSALGVSGAQDLYSPRGSGRISSQERNKSDSRGSTGSGGSRNSGRDERQSALDTVRRLTSIERKRASPVPSAPVKATAVAPSSKPVIDEEAFVKKIKSTMTEYLHLVDLKEATECFDELNMAPTQSHLIVKTCLEETLEKSSAQRDHIAQLLSHLVSHGKVSPGQYAKGVVDNMELAIDVELDLPKVWSCLAELVAPIFYSSNNTVQLVCLKDLAEPLLEEGKAGAFVVEILKKLTKHMPVDTAVQYWKDSGLKMEDFFQTPNPSDINDLLQRHELEAFYSASDQTDATEDISQAEVTFNAYMSDVRKQLDMNKSHDEIFDWIEANVKTEERSRPVFVRALTSAACHKAIKQGDKNLEVDKTLIQSHSILLKKYIDDEAKELQAVYALQKLFVDLEQPPNILKLLFDYLYDEDVISEQTFFKWEKSDDPNESEGKGVALLSVNPFFTWLREADVESDE